MENWSIVKVGEEIQVRKGDKLILTSNIDVDDPDFKYIRSIAATNLMVRILKMAQQKFYTLNQDDETAKLTKEILEQIGFND